MSVGRFYPYQTSESSLSLSLEALQPPLEPGADGSFKIFDPDIETVKMSASVCLAGDYLEKVIAQAERSDPPVNPCLILSSVESRQRKVVPLEGDGTIFAGDLTFLRHEWIGSVHVQAVLVRTRKNAQLPAGYATDAGAKLAWSDLVEISFDEPPSPPGRNMVVEWKSFREDPQLNQYNLGHLFALETQGPLPKLYLNEDVAGAYTVLTSNATHGRRAAVRDATYQSISHQVWSSLLAIAITALVDTKGPGEGAPPDIDEVGGWQQNVLIAWAPLLFPGHNPDDAVRELQRIVNDQVGVEDVLARLTRAIQNRFETFRGFEGLVRHLEVS